MLRSVRQVRSFPSLRQATAFQASSGQPQRSLASTVLLTSWTQARVPDLKEELKKRGLSTVGKKAELVGRLTQHEAAQSKMPSIRAASTTPPMTTDEKPARLADSEIAATAGDEISAVDGVKVSSQLVEDLPTAEEFGESPTEAPGMPENPFADKPATFDYQLPDFKQEPEPGTPIPWILAFNSDKFPSSSVSPSQAAPQEPHVAKLFTAADPSTHLGGGPSAALETPISADPMKTDAVVEGGADHPGRKLNADERKGLYVLAGILAAGLGLSSLTNPKVRKAAKKLEKDAERLAHDGKQKVERLAHEGKDKAEELLHKGQAKGEQALAKGKAKVEEGKDKAEALLAKGQAKGEKALEQGKAKVEEGKNKAEKAAAEAKAKGEELLSDGKAKGEKALAKGEKAAAEAKGEAKRVAKGVKDE